jgi:hypothetical protein
MTDGGNTLLNALACPSATQAVSQKLSTNVGGFSQEFFPSLVEHVLAVLCRYLYACCLECQRDIVNFFGYAAHDQENQNFLSGQAFYSASRGDAGGHCVWNLLRKTLNVRGDFVLRHPVNHPARSAYHD